MDLWDWILWEFLWILWDLLIVLSFLDQIIFLHHILWQIDVMREGNKNLKCGEYTHLMGEDGEYVLI